MKMKKDICPACRGNNTEFVFYAKDSLVSGESFAIIDCNDCGLRFTDPFPEEETIGRYYESEEYHSHMEKSRSLHTKIYGFVRNFALKGKANLTINKSGRNSGEILDVGCGTGEFLKKMQSRGWQVTGLDASSRAREIARKKNEIDVLEPVAIGKLGKDRFNAITMWHSLEHFHDPGLYLKSLSEALKPDGILVIAVPNYRSLDGEHYGAVWAAYDVPRHLYHFTKETLVSLLNSNGFRLESLKAMPFDPFYISLLSEKQSAGSVLRGLITGTRSWFAALTRPSRASSVIYFFKKKQNN